MPDLAPPRSTYPASLAGGIRWEVVVVHVALGLYRLYCIEPLGESQIGERKRREDLRLSAGEEPSTVHARDNPNLCSGRPNLIHGSKIGALTILKIQLAERLFLQGRDRRVYLLGLLQLTSLHSLCT